MNQRQNMPAHTAHTHGSFGPGRFAGVHLCLSGLICAPHMIVNPTTVKTYHTKPIVACVWRWDASY